ncbi:MULTISPECIES: hypothetical protein [Nonomuraea]|uniref:Uncharacterized protein n=1 Tax=Nonomuraea ferruginea TaxID=46174 RepID=A0ABT4TBZ2_9ACTN|nr:hypothetical protein [Nonomuraea ferruginea]MDA0647027.1 hypothetical protein [Nonomuraea ferruginea]
MFFEPPPAREELTSPPRPALPAWSAPPGTELGAATTADRVLARGPNVAVALSTIRAFSTGCLLNVEVVLRQGDLSPEVFWDLQMSLYPFARIRSAGDRLPDRLLRFGVRYPGGAKATTIEANGHILPGQGPPAGPLLSWLPVGGAMRGGHDLAGNSMALWLWPLPPAEPFEFAVEWPLGGIGLTFTELDGATVVSAARRSAPYWP